MNRIIQGDCRDILKTLPEKSVQTCITSPPYFGLRDYGVENQIGLEPTPDEFVAALVEVFREVKRVLKDDGTVWLNLGDTYFGSGQGFGDTKTTNKGHNGSRERKKPKRSDEFLKPKDLIGIPWRVAFALQADGWYLRSDIIWSKPNPMPESVTDRPTKAHEYIFLLSKNERYYYDHVAIKEERKMESVLRDFRGVSDSHKNTNGAPGQTPHSILKPRLNDKQRGHGRRHAGFNDRWDSMSKEEQQLGGANKRSVWTVSTKPFKEAHFATFPPDLITPCVLAGSRCGDVVLDPFSGAGTTAMVAQKFGRNYIGIELNPEYIKISEKRLLQEPLFREAV